jgi:hypothetical protein
MEKGKICSKSWHELTPSHPIRQQNRIVEERSRTGGSSIMKGSMRAPSPFPFAFPTAITSGFDELLVCLLALPLV